MLEKLKIDSFKLRIPRVLVKFIDPKFASKYQKVYTNTGEIDEHINLDQNKVNIENGITTRIGVVHSMDAEGGSEYVVFQLNSKPSQPQATRSSNTPSSRSLSLRNDLSRHHLLLVSSRWSAPETAPHFPRCLLSSRASPFRIDPQNL